jgi:hypothetical protein
VLDNHVAGRADRPEPSVRGVRQTSTAPRWPCCHQSPRARLADRGKHLWRGYRAHQAPRRRYWAAAMARRKTSDCSANRRCLHEPGEGAGAADRAARRLQPDGVRRCFRLVAARRACLDLIGCSFGAVVCWMARRPFPWLAAREASAPSSTTGRLCHARGMSRWPDELAAHGLHIGSAVLVSLVMGSERLKRRGLRAHGGSETSSCESTIASSQSAAGLFRSGRMGGAAGSITVG